jgi:hypothetical protein
VIRKRSSPRCRRGLIGQFRARDFLRTRLPVGAPPQGFQVGDEDATVPQLHAPLRPQLPKSLGDSLLVGTDHGGQLLVGVAGGYPVALPVTTPRSPQAAGSGWRGAPAPLCGRTRSASRPSVSINRSPNRRATLVPKVAFLATSSSNARRPTPQMIDDSRASTRSLQGQRAKPVAPISVPTFDHRDRQLPPWLPSS